MTDFNELLTNIEKLNRIGVALSVEEDNARLLEAILLGAKEITNADGGTLYTVTDDNQLKFEIMRTDSLGIAMGGKTGKDIPFPPLPLYQEDGSENKSMVAAYTALKDTTINIKDAYVEDGFDFSGTRRFDHQTGYHSKSFLTVPMKNHEKEVIGVLQLLNALDPKTGDVVPFSTEKQQLAESLASQAAVAMTNHKLINELKNLFEAFIELIANAIDEKSPYTGGHCRRVPELSMLLAESAIKSNIGIWKNFHMSEKELYELRIASWLHDCGKITTPQEVVDKPTKLSAIFDRIDLIATRYEVIKRDAEIEMLQAKVKALEEGRVVDEEQLQESLKNKLLQYDEEFSFLQHSNFGGEFMRPEDQQRVQDIASHTWKQQGQERPFLNDNEIENLNISRGTLTAPERTIINNHIVVTIDMLEKLPYPKALKRVPELAGCHHERMDGKGYPRGLVRDQMSLPARMMGIADIFEALTAGDRPYKKANTLSEALFILGKMKLDNHVDPDIFDLFVREKIYLKYAQEFLDPKQIDEVDESKIPGYEP